MSEPFLGEIKIISWNYAPKGWALCNGQFLPINQNQALFSLLGTMYGGNGQTTFALPDFRGKIPMHVGAGFTQGQTAGQYAHTVTQSEMPAHLHFMDVTNNAGTSPNPGSGFILAKSVANSYNNATSLITMNAASVGNVGGSQPHENKQPYLVLNFAIALQGIFPSQN
ncbi:MAG: tail fiber protein [Pyrinomonadaceae bacterium]